MKEIEFSVMEDWPGSSNNLLPLLEEFESQHGIHTNLIGIPWEQGWGEIAKYGIYGHGPDLSEIGTSWIGSLASMEALHPFTPAQISALGGADSFFKASWCTGLLPGDDTLWAVPWLGDICVLVYWRDIFEKAGITDFKDALASHASFAETLEKLQNAGYPYPLEITTTNTGAILHDAACWLWGAGGDFISPDQKKVTFTEGKAFEGWKNYFGLLRFISPETRIISSQVHELFRNRRAVVDLTGSWLGNIKSSQNPKLFSLLRTALVPGIPYVGGSSFVIWKYSQRSQEAFELIRFLSSQSLHLHTNPLHADMLSTRRDVIDMLDKEKDESQHVFAESLKTGHSFPTARLWGSIEDKLNKEIANIWGDLFANPKQDLDDCIHRHLDPLAYRLNLALMG
jgi:multiple sugar transport system substrate-binding protein